LDNEAAARRLIDILGIDTEPVAVFLLGPESPPPTSSLKKVTGHRYCQLIMRARHGESVALAPEELACPAAFGFRPLPEGLATGKGLVGFGIVDNPATGRRMFESMPRLEPGRVTLIAALPLCAARAIPDIIIVEGPPEAHMWLVLADLNLAGGKRRRGDTAVLQATCVDATIIPYIEQRLNFSLGCYGCREATDLSPHESVLGFPGSRLEPLLAALESLANKAIGRSRAKAVYENLNK
jgi:uncharacterized protein (DUF169 family)